MKKLLFLLTIISLMSVNILGQAIPKQIDYQGVLKTAAGAIVPDGNYPMTFKIYDAPTGGSALWTETQTIAVANGIFSAHLGSVTPITGVPFNVVQYLGIMLGAEPELAPRTMLTPSPYSFMAMDVVDNTVVKSVNGLKDDVNLVAGTNITLTPSGNNITIDAAGGGGTIGGSGNSNYLPKFTAGTTLGNSLLYEIDGKIGLGTTTPDFNFSINSTSTGGLGLKVSRNGGGLVGLSILEDSQPATLRGWSFEVYNQKLGINAADDNGFSVLKNLMTFQRNGFVGIGINAPVTNLHLLIDQYVPNSGLTLQQVVNSNRWQFYVSQSTNVLRLYYNDLAMGAFDNTNGNYTPVSDMRLKKNIQPIGNMLNTVMALQPKTYQMKNENNSNSVNYGLIAQEVENVLPDIVTIIKGDDGDGIQDLRMLSYTELIPVLIKAVQEQQVIIEGLSKRIESLERK